MQNMKTYIHIHVYIFVIFVLSIKHFAMREDRS